MRNFSQFINESIADHDSVSLLQSEISSYIRKVNKILPKNIQDLVNLTNKYNLGSKSDIEEIRQSNKSKLGDLAVKFNIPDGQMELIYSLLKSAGKNIRLLPQYQSPTERAAIEAGKLSTSDLTIDLETSTGRNAAAKMYAPIVLKIASQYVGKSRLDRPSLISAGMEGLTNAMADWKRPSNDGGKKTTFRTYASYRIQQAILDEINTQGHSLTGTNWYAAEKYGAAALDAISIDHSMGSDSDDDDFKQDHMLGLSVNPTDVDADVSKEEEQWKSIFKIMDNKFSTRDMDIFYRYFGLGPYHGHRQKSKDIAKEYGMSEGNIRNSIINKIIKFLQTNPQAHSIISNIKDMYMESLIVDMLGMDKDYIIESLYNDPTYIMLEEITRWSDKAILTNAVYAACDKMSITDAKFIFDCLMNGVDYLNQHLKKNKKLVVWFLSEVYPAIGMQRKSDVDLVGYMTELIDAAKKLKIEW